MAAERVNQRMDVKSYQKAEVDFRVVSEVVRTERIVSFEIAGALTGYRVVVFDPGTFYVIEGGITARIPKSHSGVYIIRPEGHIDHSPFWLELKEIEGYLTSGQSND